LKLTLAEKGVGFDLVHYGGLAAVLQQVLEISDGEVGDADGANKTGVSATAYVDQKYLGDYDKLSTDDAVSLLQKSINMSLTGDAATAGRITVSYDPVAQGFKFLDSTKGETVAIRGGGVTAEANSVLGLSAAGTTIAADGSYIATGDTAPNGTAIREITKNLITGVETNPQRYGLKVDFDSVNQKFTTPPDAHVS